MGAACLCCRGRPSHTMSVVHELVSDCTEFDTILRHPTASRLYTAGGTATSRRQREGGYQTEAMKSCTYEYSERSLTRPKALRPEARDASVPLHHATQIPLRSPSGRLAPDHVLLLLVLLAARPPSLLAKLLLLPPESFIELPIEQHVDTLG